METRNEKLEERLEGLYEKNVDAQKGYDNAAENADSHGLRAFFRKKAQERREFNLDLRTEITSSYGEIEEGGSAAGSIHRTWMDIKSFFSGNSDESMLEACITGDKASLEEYEEILKDEHLPTTLGALIRNQKMKIRTDLNKVRSLEDIQDVD